MHLVRRISTLAFTGALLAGAACSNDDDPTAPTVTQVVGDYQATRFTVTTTLGTENILQSGGSITTTFAEAGTVTGHVTIPSESVDEDFTGTWKLDGGKVQIKDIPTDLFFQDIAFTPVGKTLVANEMLNGVRVQVTLTKR